MAMIDWGECAARLDDGVRALGVRVPKASREIMIDYLRELTTWNATYNLTAVRDPLAMVTRHVLDSLAVAPFVVGTSLADRKSTRLNSSHVSISYAVFCLKKKSESGNVHRRAASVEETVD